MKLKNLFLTLVLLFAMCSCSFAASRSDFMYLYQSEWSRANLKYKLSRVVENEFIEEAKSSTFNTFALKLGLNSDNIVEKIQKSIFTEFYGDYRELLEHLSRRLPKEYQQIQSEAEKNFVGKIWPGLKNKLAHPFKPLNWFVVGVMVILLRNVMARFFGTFFGKYSKRSKATKKLKIAFSLAGLMFFIIGVYHVSQMTTITRMESRKFLYESTRDFYVVELPETFLQHLE